MEEEAATAAKAGSSTPSPSQPSAPAPSSAGTAPQPSRGGDRYFRPDNGFCIRTKTTGNDGLKIRAEGQGKTLYINFCSHLAVDLPMDAFGTQVVNFTSANGLSVPLVVGPIRDLESTAVDDPTAVPARGSAGGSSSLLRKASLAVDVVFHKAVMEAGEKGAGFKSQIVSLAMDWVGKETGETHGHSLFVTFIFIFY